MADNDQLLKQIAELIKASEERTKKELSATITAAEERLKQAILDSQEDTIEALKEYIHTAYNMLDKRIEKIEDELELPHPDKNLFFQRRLFSIVRPDLTSTSEFI